MTQTIYVLGEGGGIHPMDLPLPEPIQERLTKGLLRRVNKDGTPYAEEPEPEGAGDGGDGTVPEAGQQVPGPPLTRPADTANKPLWVGWAVVNGADADEANSMTKADLIEKYG